MSRNSEAIHNQFKLDLEQVSNSSINLSKVRSTDNNGLVVFASKCSFFLHMCACTMPLTVFYDSKFYYRLRQPIAVLVWARVGFYLAARQSR